MTKIPFGKYRRVRYQDETGKFWTVRAKLLKPDLAKQPWAAVVLEISTLDGSHVGSRLAIRSNQIVEIDEEYSPPPPPTSSHAPWFG